MSTETFSLGVVHADGYVETKRVVIPAQSQTLTLPQPATSWFSDSPPAYLSFQFPDQVRVSGFRIQPDLALTQDDLKAIRKDLDRGIRIYVDGEHVDTLKPVYLVPKD